MGAELGGGVLQLGDGLRESFARPETAHARLTEPYDAVRRSRR